MLLEWLSLSSFTCQELSLSAAFESVDVYFAIVRMVCSRLLTCCVFFVL